MVVSLLPGYWDDYYSKSICLEVSGEVPSGLMGILVVDSGLNSEPVLLLALACCCFFRACCFFIITFLALFILSLYSVISTKIWY